MIEFLPFFLVFAVLWVAQLYATSKQSQAFMRSVGALRAHGVTAIGASSHNRLRRRSYVALASDEDDRVTAAVELSGLTVFARAVPVPELVGATLRELADVDTDAADRRASAAQMAARSLLGEPHDGSAATSVASDAAEIAGAVERTPTAPSRHLPSRPGRSDVRDERVGGS